MENLQDQPGGVWKFLKDLKAQEPTKTKRSPLSFPRVEGLLRGRTVFLVGNSPSLKKIPSLWEELSRPGVITMALNRVTDQITPTFWLCGDGEFTTQWGNTLPGEGVDPKKTVRVLHSGAGAALKMGEPWVPFQVHLRDKGWGRHLDKIYHYPTSDLQALQILHGVMKASIIFLVGIDHNYHAKETHGMELTGMDQAKHDSLIDFKQDDDGPFMAMINQGYRRAMDEVRRSTRPIYTCSPVEGTVVRKHLPYMIFETAMGMALLNVTNHPDLDELRHWRPYGEKYKVVYGHESVKKLDNPEEKR